MRTAVATLAESSLGIVKMPEGRSGDTYRDSGLGAQGRLHRRRRVLPRLTKPC
jgi:hypothetical protein